MFEIFVIAIFLAFVALIAVCYKPSISERPVSPTPPSDDIAPIPPSDAENLNWD